MIAFLKGIVEKKLDRQIILNTGGVGYLVSLTNQVLQQIIEQESVCLFVMTQVKPEEISLYGFKEWNELYFFKQLLSISGIGAKTALSILEFPIHLTQKALFEENHNFLQSIPGLGKKTVARLILEMKSKVSEENFLDHMPSIPSLFQEEAIEALVRLGYEKAKIIRFLHTMEKPFESSEDLIKTFLQQT